MLTSFFCIAGAASALAASVPRRDQFESSAYAAQDVVERDFAIVGGGAAGTYAAISLLDQNKTFTLVEITDRLGGHTNTYHDPATGAYVDFGVQIHLNCQLVRDFFARLNSPLANASLADFGAPQYYDFAKKVALHDYTPPTVQPDYTTLLNQYPYIDDLDNLPQNPPSDLLLTWPQFAAKHKLSAGST